jgi:hypothetical protein
MREIKQPLRRQLLVFKDFRDNPGTVDGWSRDLCPRKPREHGKSLRLGGLRSTDYVQSTHALAVQTEVLGERLCYEQFLRSVAQEVSNGPCVIGQIASGKALTFVRISLTIIFSWNLLHSLRQIEERYESLLFAYIGNNPPLFSGEIQPRRVVRTSMQYYYIARRSPCP